MKQQIIHYDLAYIPFQVAWNFQERLLKENAKIKLAANHDTPPHTLSTQHYLLTCEHPHVYTLGKSGKEAHLLITEELLAQHQATFVKINRGGDITYHGPGQLVVYPILDLEKFDRDLHVYLRNLEEVVIRLLAIYGIAAGRLPGATGVWIDEKGKYPRKVCAMGIRCSRWISMHGLALNINTDLAYFSHIVPCGIADKAVTSMAQELGYKLAMQDVKHQLLFHFSEVFDVAFVEQPIIVK